MQYIHIYTIYCSITYIVYCHTVYILYYLYRTILYYSILYILYYSKQLPLKEPLLNPKLGPVRIEQIDLLTACRKTLKIDRAQGGPYQGSQEENNTIEKGGE